MDREVARHLDGLDNALRRARDELRDGFTDFAREAIGEANGYAQLLRKDLTPSVDMVEFAAQICGMKREVGV